VCREAAGRFVKPEPVLNSQGALQDSDVRLLHELGFNDSQVIGEIKKRGLVRAVDDHLAGVELSKILHDLDYILAPSERVKYEHRQAEHKRPAVAIRAAAPTAAKPIAGIAYQQPKRKGGSNAPPANANNEFEY